MGVDKQCCMCEAPTPRDTFRGDRSPFNRPFEAAQRRANVRSTRQCDLTLNRYLNMASRPQVIPHRPVSSDFSTDDRTLCEQTSDDEGYDGRPSGELSEGDHDILESEDERERLLTQKEGMSGMFGRRESGVKIGHWERKAEMNERRKSGNEESSALMYEMEEGMGASNTSLRSRRSSESDEQRLLAIRSQRQARLPSNMRG